MADCKPQAADCSERGFSWFDWASSIHRRICDVIAWLAGIFDNTRIANNGTQALIPVHHHINISGDKITVNIPAGAVAIQAVIDNDYAAAFRLEVQKAGDVVRLLPAGADFQLDAITPIFTANATGNSVRQGHGTYPAYTFKWPAGSRGFVTAIYVGTAPDFTVS